LSKLVNHYTATR